MTLEPKSPEISIIVPVYKVERYLRQCLDSIRAQTFRDWECILVDDGSPDNCGAICEEYASQDPRFGVIHRSNGGLSAARNSGLAVARGRYIGFVDSDDWASPDLFRRLHELITTYEADVAQVGFQNEYVGFSRPKPLAHTVEVLDRPTLIRELFRDKKLPNYMWNKLFRREVIDTPFPEGKKFEDIYMFNSWSRNISALVMAPDILYHYRSRRGSIMYSDFSRNCMDYFNACIERAKALNAIDSTAMTRAQTDTYRWKIAINAAKSIARFEKDTSTRDEAIRAIRDVSLTFGKPSVLKLGPKKYLRARLLRHDPERFSRLMRMVYKTDLQSHHRMSMLFD
ncbi:MAG: glycosyltransferase [Muribaculaceae bacterium]|nr:glycosyltransferase [Muribaculaceae bacterium]